MITPWNFPLLIVSQKLPFALAVGCTAVVKPSDLTPGTTTRLVQILHEEGLPAGAVNLVHGGGDVGGWLSGHPGTHMTTFTGSTGVGRMVAQAAAKDLKKVSLELGGKNPQVVFPDADLDAALEKVVFGAYFNQGECCNAGSRLLVHADIADEFTERVVARAQDVNVGDPLDPGTLVGALISDKHLGVVGGYVDLGQTEGATVALGGERLESDRGRYYSPTVLAGVPKTARVAREEIFGPVLSVVSVRRPRRGGGDHQRHRVRAQRRGLEPRHRHRPRVRPRHQGRHGLGQLLHGRLPRDLLRRLRSLRHRPGARAYRHR